MALDWTTFMSGAAGAFGAAWIGAYVGFRRSKKERALDRLISWHESTIQSLALYEEQLDRIRSYSLNLLVVQRTKTSLKKSKESTEADPMPTLIRVPAPLWKELREIESETRNGLRLGDLYTEGRTQTECSVALTNTVNVVSGQWLDVSEAPEVPWASVTSKTYAVASVRRSIQESLRIVLELDGFLASILGRRYRKWAKLRSISRLRAEFMKEAEDNTKRQLEQSTTKAS